MTKFRNLLAFFAIFTLLNVPVSADENKIPEPFRGETSGSNIQINYADWSAVLKQTVFEAGRSDRRTAKSQQASIGTRMKKGNQSSTRNEGNRIIFPAFAKVDENLDYIRKIRKELEAIPGDVPMKDWSKNEQLAYWLNLYNITLIEQLAEIYPVKSLKKLMKSSKKKPSIWDRKILKVAGIDLSLNDIHHTILAEKWDTTLPMYGLFQGYVGAPNVRNTAYTANNVRSMLLENAKEFVNSNRGMKVQGKTLQISEYYKINKAKFPNWKEDLKKHFINLAEFDMRRAISETSKIKATTRDYYIADLFGAERNSGTSVATNEAALDDMQVHLHAGVPAGAGASMGIGNMTFAQFSDFSKASNIPRLPPQVLEFIEKSRKRKSLNEGKVGVEEITEEGTNN